MPAFEGLLPLRHNQTVADLLFELVNWHALAKLRMHTQVTVDIFKACTSHMYAAVRVFARHTCEEIETHELQKEANARARRQGQGARGKQTTTGRKTVKFGTWKTYKYHVLADSPQYVERSGPLETTSTRTVSMSSSVAVCITDYQLLGRTRAPPC